MKSKKNLVDAGEHYAVLDEIYRSCNQKNHSAFTSIIDKYISISHGLPPPEDSREHDLKNRGARRASLTACLKDRRPDPLTPSRVGVPSQPPPATPSARSFTEEDLIKEVQESLKKRKQQLGLPDDYQVEEMEEEGCASDLQHKKKKKLSTPRWVGRGRSSTKTSLTPRPTKTKTRHSRAVKRGRQTQTVEPDVPDECSRTAKRRESARKAVRSQTKKGAASSVNSQCLKEKQESLDHAARDSPNVQSTSKSKPTRGRRKTTVCSSASLTQTSERGSEAEMNTPREPQKQKSNSDDEFVKNVISGCVPILFSWPENNPVFYLTESLDGVFEHPPVPQTHPDADHSKEASTASKTAPQRKTKSTPRLEETRKEKREKIPPKAKHSVSLIEQRCVPVTKRSSGRKNIGRNGTRETSGVSPLSRQSRALEVPPEAQTLAHSICHPPPEAPLPPLKQNEVAPRSPKRLSGGQSTKTHTPVNEAPSLSDKRTCDESMPGVCSPDVSSEEAPDTPSRCKKLENRKKIVLNKSLSRRRGALVFESCEEIERRRNMFNFFKGDSETEVAEETKGSADTHTDTQNKMHPSKTLNINSRTKGLVTKLCNSHDDIKQTAAMSEQYDDRGRWNNPQESIISGIDSMKRKCSHPVRVPGYVHRNTLSEISSIIESDILVLEPCEPVSSDGTDSDSSVSHAKKRKYDPALLASAKEPTEEKLLQRRAAPEQKVASCNGQQPAVSMNSLVGGRSPCTKPAAEAQDTEDQTLSLLPVRPHQGSVTHLSRIFLNSQRSRLQETVDSFAFSHRSVDWTHNTNPTSTTQKSFWVMESDEDCDSRTQTHKPDGEKARPSDEECNIRTQTHKPDGEKARPTATSKTGVQSGKSSLDYSTLGPERWLAAVKSRHKGMKPRYLKLPLHTKVP